MRKLKWHEQRLLKKTDFYSWSRDDNTREVAICRKYAINDREEYHKYNKLCGKIRKLISKLRHLPPEDTLRVSITNVLLRKLKGMGVVKAARSLADVEEIPASRFIERRLNVLILKNKMVSNKDHANNYIESGQVRIGPEVVTNPATLVSTEDEDHITWAEGSKVKRAMHEFKNVVDDFDLMDM
ncbi:MAG: uncharacterized protein KVP18_005029 [Porospora cf. gigantea A]|uniref:uncharacterized protein n=2 Tax=Porospora cf. gigantea A TaxID=2853593 RepID=UPI00355A5B54|nr:MAG: hypothetical protein KVP18_005029 [Porospora cf. gigantea A]